MEFGICELLIQRMHGIPSSCYRCFSNKMAHIFRNILLPVRKGVADIDNNRMPASSKDLSTTAGVVTRHMLIIEDTPAGWMKALSFLK